MPNTTGGFFHLAAAPTKGQDQHQAEKGAAHYPCGVEEGWHGGGVDLLRLGFQDKC
jgi:hypothetical protein